MQENASGLSPFPESATFSVMDGWMDIVYNMMMYVASSQPRHELNSCEPVDAPKVQNHTRDLLVVNMQSVASGYYK